MAFGPIIPSGAVNSTVAVPMPVKWNTFLQNVFSLPRAARERAADEIERDLLDYLATPIRPATLALSANDQFTLNQLKQLGSPGNAEYRAMGRLIAGAVRQGVLPHFTYVVRNEAHWLVVSAEISMGTTVASESVAVPLPPRGATRAAAAALARQLPPEATIGIRQYDNVQYVVVNPPPGVTHFTVRYDMRLDSTGVPVGESLAADIFASCEADYARLCAYFGMAANPGGAAPAHFDVYIDEGVFGAMHESCHATEIHCSAVMGLQPGVVPMMLAAEIAEVFAATKHNGWRCRHTNGEALSRVLAEELHPRAFGGFLAGSYWLNNRDAAGNPDRPDFVNDDVHSDTELVSVGCGVLFLNYLRYQRKQSWRNIIAAGGNTLGDTYRTLTRKSGQQGFAAFLKLMNRRYPPGRNVLLRSDNPF
ncbi:MAG TPA: hypothetical protein VKV26_14005 [Dehalococcoidia bacterium]|nr:hypothetical protein [Dehalococcoidia bacterium]